MALVEALVKVEAEVPRRARKQAFHCPGNRSVTVRYWIGERRTKCENIWVAELVYIEKTVAGIGYEMEACQLVNEWD